MKLYWKIHTPNLLREIAINPQIGPVVKGLEYLGQILFALADRARELNDEELNSLCCRLTLFSQADPESPDYDKSTSKLIHRFDKKITERINKNL